VGEQIEGGVVAGKGCILHRAYGDGDACGNVGGHPEEALHEGWSTGGVWCHSEETTQN